MLHATTDETRPGLTNGATMRRTDGRHPEGGPDVRSCDRDRLRDLTARERAAYAEAHPRSRELFEQAAGTLLAGVPMSWMSMLTGDYPVYFDGAGGNRITDVDGHTYIDFCLGDTGSMTGHSPQVVAGCDRPAAAREGRHHHNAPDRGCGLRGRGAAAPLRPAVLAVLAHRHGRQPLGAAHGAHGAAASLRPRVQRVLPRHRGRDHHRGRAGRSSPWRSRATWARRWIRPRPPGSSSSTTSRPCAPRWRRAMWPPC